MNTPTIKRIPRPKGLTHLGYILDKERTKDNLHKFRAHIIRAFISGNLFLPNTQDTYIKAEDKEATKKERLRLRKELKASKPLPNTSAKKHKKYLKDELNRIKDITIYKRLYVEEVNAVTIEQLSFGLGIPLPKLIVRLEKAYLKDANQMATEQGRINLEVMARGAISGIFFKSLDKAHSLGQWANELQAVARLRNYGPAQVMQANSAMAMDLAGNKQVFDMATKIQALNGTKPLPYSGTPNVNIQNNIGTQIPTSGTQYLTPTMAQKHLEEMGLTKAPLDMALLAQQYGINGPDLPDIQATPDDAQGTQVVDIKNLGFDTMLEDSGEIPDDHHDTRRQKEMNIIEGLVT